MFSYWEQQSYFTYDHIIIGSGIVGLSTAVELKARNPGVSVLVLERGLLPTGASTKNAGFACMGSVTELFDDLETMTEDDVVALFEQRKRGLELLRSRLGDKHIGYAQRGSYELISKRELKALERIHYLNNLLLPVNKKPSFRLANEKIKEFGFTKEYTLALVENVFEGEIDTGKMMRSLAGCAAEHGIEIKTGANVLRFEEGSNCVTVLVDNPMGKDPVVLRCSTLSICTNAFTKQLLPHEDVTPGRGQVLITKPVPGLKFKGIFHFDKGYYYFRELDGRVLIGGGRNADFKGEATNKISVTEKIQAKLEQKLQDIIIPGTRYEVDMRWAGIMAFGANKQPVIRRFTQRVFGAFRMGGMGVAMGSLAGKLLAAINHD